DAADGLRAVFEGYLQIAEDDAVFRYAMLGEGLDWEDVEEHKALFAGYVERIMQRGISLGVIRDDITFADFPMLVCGVLATMYYQPGPRPDWRRHLALTLRAVMP
ncbi:hypothetical protein, partial [uncultured Aeromicrobium sp.]|uniref:hypothetical protein n=1 Tax=uncultured Aeromicrobium sp. TaxID=337820 RepID=UPI002600663A